MRYTPKYTVNHHDDEVDEMPVLAKGEQQELEWSCHVLKMLTCFLLLLLFTCGDGFTKNQSIENQIVYSRKSLLEPSVPVYSFAVHPLHNPKRLFGAYQPLVDLINSNISNFQVKLIASRDYSVFERRLYAGKFDVAVPNPLQALRCLEAGYRIVGKMADDERFHGMIITRKNSGILFVEDLEGKELSFPAPTALAATLMPKLYLKKRGLVIRDELVHYVGSQESAIMNVYLGKTEAAGTWSLPWDLILQKRPELGDVLKVQWSTDPLVNNAVVMHNSMPAEHQQAIRNILFALHESTEGRALLRNMHVSRFMESSVEAYAPVTRFLREYDGLFPETFGELLP